MSKSAVSVANNLLAQRSGGFEIHLIHTFDDDTAAHDDQLHSRVHQDCESAFDDSCAELRLAFGPPTRTGSSDNESIPMSGVFRFAIWEIEGRQLFIAAAHEDRECPFLLLLGTTDPPPRRWFRFTLRTMFVVLTAFSLWLGYEANWMRQRRAYLSIAEVYDLSETFGKTAADRPRAPGLLWLFGEQGVKYLVVMRRSPADFSRAAKLFPEADCSQAAFISGGITADY